MNWMQWREELIYKPRAEGQICVYFHKTFQYFPKTLFPIIELSHTNNPNILHENGGFNIEIKHIKEHNSSLVGLVGDRIQLLYLSITITELCSNKYMLTHR